MSESLASTLFTTEGAAASSENPALVGGQCQACGYVFFPFQDYGCERCGSVRIDRRAIAGKGRLVASADVCVSMNKERLAPFVIGSIETDEGAVVRSLLDVAPGAGLQQGAEMVTVLVPETREGRGEFDLRFVPIERKA